jgi:predicted RND superfamily exporter protein
MRQKIFDMLATITGKYPWLVLLCALVLTAGAVGLSGNLRMETRVLDLLPADDPASVQYNDIINQYSSASQIMVGINGDDRKEMIAVAEEIKSRAGAAEYTDKDTGEKKPYVKRVVARADVEFLSKHGLMLTKVRDLENVDALYQNLDMAPMLLAYNDFLEREYIEDSGSVTEREKEDRAIDGLKNIIVWLEGVLQVDKGETQLGAYVDRATDLLTMGNPYMFSDDNELLLVLVTPSISVDRTEETLEGAASLRDIVSEIQKEHKSVNVRMTGMPVLMMEEMDYVLGDMGISSVVSLVLVLVLFVLAFRMWTSPILAIINLILGIIWTTGLIAIVFGRLNLFTVMFAVILIGLGIDFAIHLNAAFSTARSRGDNVIDSLRAMYRNSGPGVITGALTTAAAFFALAFTGLDALVELGVVLGAGIVLTMLASLTVLPAMYAVHVRASQRLSKGKHQKTKPIRLTFPFLASLGKIIYQKPWPVLIAFLMITAGFGYVFKDAEFEKDMLEMEPEEMPSVHLHREILKRFELHPDFVMTISKSLEETRPVVKKMKKNRLVGRVDAVTEFLPSEKEQKRRTRLLKQISERMTAIVAPPQGAENANSDPDTEGLLGELDRLQMNVQEIGQMAFVSVKNRLHRTCERLTGGEDEKFSVILGLKEQFKNLSGLDAKMTAYQAAYVPVLANKMKGMANTTPIVMEMLPETITERYMSAEGSNLVTVYASVDLWHGDKMELFLDATSGAAKQVTGAPILNDRLIKLVGKKGTIGIFLALGAIFLILLIDFRSLRYAFLGMVPLVGGFIWMVGLFVLFGWKFDVSNVMALPLILGIGIDDAVHILHAVKRRGMKNLPDILRHTGRALLLTSLTTSIAFGAIAFSSHRGLAGMGFLLVLGVVSCFIASVVLLPAVMRIFLGDKTSKEQQKEANDA